MQARCVLAILVLTTSSACMAAPWAAPADGLDLLLLHTNDMHARFEQTNKFSGTCSKSDDENNKCYGGYARVSAVIKKAREEEASGEGPPVLVLNAGDNYQGTVYYSVFKWNISAHFTERLHFDALSLGNHEFDDEVAGLVPFVKAVKAPIVTANIDLSEVPELQGLNLRPSVVLEKNGVKIGVIGYITPETTFLSSPGKVKFSEEVPVLQAEAARLKKDGVNIIIALGHSGYDMDKVIAREVPDLDLVIGGHSHSFLYTGPQPDVDVPVGAYPTVIVQPSGRKVPVVQAYAFTKYMGRLRLKFGPGGELVDLEARPMLLNGSFPQDPEILADVQTWKEQLDQRILDPVGKCEVLLDAEKCRQKECNVGNLIADSYVDYRARTYKGGDGWTDAPISLQNGGGIRTSVDPTKENGTLTVKDIMEILPFENEILILKLKGSVLLEALEHAVANYTPNEAWRGSFLQVSGLRVRYDVSRPPGHRVVSALARCGNCTIPMYSAVDPDAVYGVAVSGFLANGGDGFNMFASPVASIVLNSHPTESQVVIQYVRNKSPVYPGIDRRIVFEEPTPGTTSPAPATTGRSSADATYIAPLLIIALPLLHYVFAMSTIT